MFQYRSAPCLSLLLGSTPPHLETYVSCDNGLLGSETFLWYHSGPETRHQISTSVRRSWGAVPALFPSLICDFEEFVATRA
jgi:hypothetical protein